MIRSILVPTDFAEASAAALRRAEELARVTGAKLLLVHVRDEFPFVASDGTGCVPDPLTAQHAAAQTQVGTLAAEVVARGVPASGVMVLGDAARRILDVAEQEQVDLIVVGTHNRRGLERLVLGSVAQQVARGSRVAVMVVATTSEPRGPGPHRDSFLSPSGQRLPLSILVATDFEEASVAAVPCAFELAEALHAQVHIVHAYTPGELRPGADRRGNFRLKSLHHRITRRIGELAEPFEMGRVAQRIAVTGEPSARILEAALNVAADLIVVGTRGRSQIEQLCLGSVAEAVMRGATCPVVFAKIGGRAHRHVAPSPLRDDAEGVVRVPAAPVGG